MSDVEEQAMTTNDGFDRFRRAPQEFAFPRRITVELTNRCNLDCPMCPREIVKEHEDFTEGFMSMELFRKIADEMAGHQGTAMVPFFRGESLLHPKALDMLQYAKARGIGPIQLTTNATILNERIANGLLSVGLDFISFSLDAVGKRAYEAVRIGAKYERVMENIDRFLRMRDAHQGQVPEVQVSMVEGMDPDATEQEFVDRWISRVDRVRVYLKHSTDGHFGSLPGDRASARKPCLKLLTDLVIYWNGDAALCNHDWDRQEPMGNVAQTSIQDVWHNAAYTALRQQHVDGVYPAGAVCATCDHWRASYNPERYVGRLYTREQTRVG